MDGHGVFDLDLVGNRRLRIADQGDVRRGPAHVVGQKILEAGPAAGIGRGLNAGSGTRHNGLGRLSRDVAGGHHAAIAVHHQHFPAIPLGGKLVHELADIDFE